MDYTIPPTSTTISTLQLQTAARETRLTELYDQYQERIHKLSQEIQKVLNQSLQSFQNIDPRFQSRILIRLRSEATNKLDALTMPEERKSYLLHQLANCHDIENLVDLLREINYAQLRACPVFTVDDLTAPVETQEFSIRKVDPNKTYDQDLLLIISTQQGLQLAKQSFSTLAGHLEVAPGMAPELQAPNISPAEYRIDGSSALIELTTIRTSEKAFQQVLSVQASVDKLTKMGASTIGLGSKSSDITQRGLLLDPKGAQIITGENLLSGLIHQQVLAELKKKTIPAENSTLGVFGILHPPLSSISLLLADSLKKIILFHHTPVEFSLKLQQAVCALLSGISKSEEESAITEIIRHSWKDQRDLLAFLSQPLVKRVFEVTTDLTLVKEVQILLTDSSPLTNMLREDMLKNSPVLFNLETSRLLGPEYGQSLVEAEMSLLKTLKSPSTMSKKELIQALTHSALSGGYTLG